MPQVLARGFATSLLALLAAGALAQGAPTAEVDTSNLVTGWHMVRPGESLAMITARYLGSADRWRENWELNPQIQNANIIQPGTRLRIVLDYETAPPIARLRAVSGRVEARPVPIPWNQAQVEDVLVERDGLRTHASSSTELEFRNGTNLVLSEESLVFVRPSRQRVAGPTRRSVEIVEGQAEVQALDPTAPRTDVEILVGSATATATQTEDGRSQTRARKAVDGSAQVMVYEGASEVQAAGQSVAVPKGMGTAVPEDAPPAPPEKLLPAAQSTEPEAGSEWRYGDPWFSWESVAGAASYTLEICRDPRCGELVTRALALTETKWRPEPLPAGDYHWRITAVSASRLDGYPSEPMPFTILFTGSDTEPPTGEVSVAGRSVSHAGLIQWEPRTRLEVTMTDEQSGVESWTAHMDGRPLAEGELSGPWRTGTRTAMATGIDRAGNTGETDPLRFEVDADGPAVEVRMGHSELLAEKLGADAVPKRWERRKRKWVKARARPGVGTRPVWTVLASGSDDTPLAARLKTRKLMTARQTPDSSVEVAGNHPGVLLFVAGKLRLGSRSVILRHGGEVTLFNPAKRDGPGTEKNTVVWIAANDERTGEVVSFSVDTEVRPSETPGEAAETYLVVETEDTFGNRRRVELRMRAL